jgi:hypothetical protein
MAAGTAVAGVVSNTASREDAAKVLLEADVRFFRDAGSIGIHSLKKLLDLLLNLPVDDTDARILRWGDLPWSDRVLVDLLLHFRLHPLPSPSAKWRPVLSL